MDSQSDDQTAPEVAAEQAAAEQAAEQAAAEQAAKLFALRAALLGLADKEDAFIRAQAAVQQAWQDFIGLEYELQDYERSKLVTLALMEDRINAFKRAGGDPTLLTAFLDLHGIPEVVAAAATFDAYALTLRQEELDYEAKEQAERDRKAGIGQAPLHGRPKKEAPPGYDSFNYHPRDLE